MNKKLDQIAHGFLYLGFFIGAYAVYFWRFDTKVQFIVILSLIFFYLVWGGLYHSHKGDLGRKLGIEYLLIASISLLASVMVFLL